MARTLDITSYTLEDRDTLSDQEAIHEYSRLRHDVVRRQVERLAEAGLTQTEVYRRGMQIMSRPARGMSGLEAKAALADVSAWLRGKRKVKEVREEKFQKAAKQWEQDQRAAATLNAHGYEGIQAEEMKQFGDYMDAVRAIPEAGAYDSGRVAHAYKAMMAMGVMNKDGSIRKEIADHFKDWMARSEALDAFVAEGLPEGVSAKTPAQLERAYKAWEKEHFGAPAPAKAPTTRRRRKK